MRQLLIALALLASACSSVVYEAQPDSTSTTSVAADRVEPAARFVEESCPEWDEIAVTCGTLEVPEVRGADTDGDVVRLPVTLTAAHEGADPVVLLGDVGFSTVAESLASERQVITLATRGHWSAEPSLTCYWLADEELRPHYERCRRGFERAGIDFGAYRSAAAATDVIDLLDELGIDRVDIVAFRLAIPTAARIQEVASDRLGTVVAVEPFADGLRGLAATADRLAGLSSLCASQPACATRAGDLEARFSAALESLAASALTLPETDLQPEVEFDAERLVTLTDRLLGFESGAATIIAILDAIERGDLDYLSEVVQAMTSSSGDIHELAVVCELPAGATPDEPTWQALDAVYRASWDDICEPWNVDAGSTVPLEATELGSEHFLPVPDGANVAGLGPLNSPCLDHHVQRTLGVTTTADDPCSQRRTEILSVDTGELMQFSHLVDWGSPVTFSGTHLASWRLMPWGSIERASDVLDTASISFDVWDLPAEEVRAELMYAWETEPLTPAADIAGWQIATAPSTWNGDLVTFGIDEIAPGLTAVAVISIPRDEHESFAAETQRFLAALSTGQG